MKTTKRIQILTLLLIMFSVVSAQPDKLWETDTIFMAPESVAYDSVREVLYVSNYTKSIKDGMMYNVHYISKVNLDGTPIQIDWIGNITTPTGICVFADKLYIV